MRTRTVLMVAVLVLGTVGGPAAGLASGADVALEVVVRTAAGAPVNNAEVTASWDDGSRTRTTSSNGRVFIDVPEGTDVTIEVDHQIYVRNAPYEITAAAEGEVSVTVWEKATASITVVDDDGPVEDVRVVYRKAGDLVDESRTDAEGTVDSGVIESGEYTLSFFKAGYFEQSTSLTVRDETSEEVRIERGSVTVAFRVLDDHFDPPQPVPEASIIGSDFSTVTQPDGQRSVSVPVNTDLSITIRKAGYETVEQNVPVRERDRAINISTRRSASVTVEVSNERVVVGETVAVSVIDEYGDPLPDATVYVNGAPVGELGDAGTVRVAIEDGGDHTLFAAVGDLSSEEVTVTGVAQGEAGSIDGDDAGGIGNGGSIAGLNLRSTAIGIAGGLVLAGVLFVIVRFR